MKGNILIIVLFLLIASSLFAVLLGQQARSLLKTVYDVHDYYQAYYQAYAGIELGFAQQLLHGYGYEEKLTLAFGNDSGGPAQTNVSITSRKSIIGSTSPIGCDQRDNYLSLAGGASFIIPLFYDQSIGFDAPLYTTISSSDFVSEYEPILFFHGTVGNTLLLKIIDEQLLNYNAQRTFPASQETQQIPLSLVSYDSNDSSNKNYLIIANPGDQSQTLSFCLSLKKPMVDPLVTIESIGQYRKAQVALYGKKQFQVPGFLSYGTIQ